jgi:nucleoid-associated protein YgaU
MKRITHWMCGVGAATLVAAVPMLAADEYHPEPGVERDSAQGMGGAARENPIDKSRDAHDSMTQETAPAKSGTSGTYVVEQGDTLATIAENQMGSAKEWKVLARANDIDDPKTLRVGQKLKIPAESGREAPEPMKRDERAPSQDETHPNSSD